MNREPSTQQRQTFQTEGQRGFLARLMAFCERWRSSTAAWMPSPRTLAINIALTSALWLSFETAVGMFADVEDSVASKIQFMTMTSRQYVTTDRRKGFRLLPNFSSAEIHINADGFRGPELPDDLPDRRMVLALGESTTFGWAVLDEETYPSHLEAILTAARADRKWVVLNAGVPSYSSRQLFLYAEELLARFSPDVVMVNVLWNDFMYSCREDWTPQSLVPRYPSRLDQLLLKYSRVYRWLAMPREGPEIVNFYVTNALVEYRTNLSQIIGLCRRKGVPIVFVEPPFNARSVPKEGVAMWKNRFSQKFVRRLADIFFTVQLEEAETHHVPMIRHEFGISTDSPEERFLDFLHVDGEGNRLIAQKIADYLQSTPSAQATH